MIAEGLGRVFDVGLGWAPVDLDTSNGATGKRIYMGHATGITFLVALAVGATDDLVLDVQQHTAYTSGTSADLDAAAVSSSRGVTKWHIKTEAALDNDETWTEVTQSVASEITLTGATYGDKQNIVAVYVPATALGDGYAWVSLNAAQTTASAHLGVCLYLLHDLNVQRKASNLPNLLRPGAANA